MKGYVERNLRKSEKVVAKCHVTWTAFVPIVIRTILLIVAAWAIAELVVEIILDFRYKGIPEEGQISYFGSDEWGMISGAAYIFFAAVIVVSLISAAISIIKLVCIELVVTDKKIIGKTGVIYSNAIDAYLEKIDNFAIDESLWGRIFRYSTITIGTASITLRFPYMQNAAEFKNKVMDCYDARKTSLMTEQAMLIKAQEAAAKQAEPAALSDTSETAV